MQSDITAFARTTVMHPTRARSRQQAAAQVAQIGGQERRRGQVAAGRSAQQRDRFGDKSVSS